jgi:predicted HD phosphohydrolase
MSASSVVEVLDLYESWGAHRYDEEVTQLAHALQTAALAAGAGASDPLVAASLLHDVGHLLTLRDAVGLGSVPRGEDLHEDRGAAWLRPLFGPAVTAPIALHVRAKQYLCANDADYRNRLSAGSLRSLDRQGGPMRGAQKPAFEATAGFRDALRLRKWDDAGKLRGTPAPSLGGYRDVLERLAAEASMPR